VGDARLVLEAINKGVERKDRGVWLEQLERWRKEHPLEVRETSGLLPQYVIKKIYEATAGEAITVTGVGQYQMWAAQYGCYTKPNGLISAGGLGTMGFGLPAAVGVKVGCPDETVWCIEGDGGFQATLKELGTIVQEGLGIKLVVINDRCYAATPLSGPDFVKLAAAYGIPGLRVERREGVAPAIERALDEDGPYLIDFVVEPEDVCPD
jgi:acetolactate synthase-1/2/3 large subunit